MKCSASVSIQYDNIFSPFAGSDWRAGVDWVKRCGFDGVELILSDPDLLDAGAVADALAHVGLPASTISTGQAMGLEGLSMMSASRQTREATLMRLRRDVDFSVLLGRPNVTIGLIRGKGGALPADTERELLCRSLTEIADYAAQRGVTLNLEPINRYECKHLNDSVSALELIREIGNPENVGVLYDTFHSNIEDADMAAAIRAIAPRISNVHIADSNRRLPGEGHTDFVMIEKTLREAGYCGYVALEILNLPTREHVIECAGAALHRYFGAVEA